jgi:alpha-beta hydrolase superfamily lysophospholipase
MLPGRVAPETQTSPRSRVVARAGAQLFVSEAGDETNTTVVLVHGFPDTHLMWDELVAELSGQLHTVAYDVRGMGRSLAPGGADAFLLPELALDLRAVIDARSAPSGAFISSATTGEPSSAGRRSGKATPQRGSRRSPRSLAHGSTQRRPGRSAGFVRP